MSLEQTLKDLLNAGIGLFHTGERSFHEALTEAQKKFQELKQAGEGDNSPEAQKLRDILDSAIKNLKDITEKTESNWDTTEDQFKKSFGHLLIQLEKTVGEEKIQVLKDKLAELGDYMKKSGQDKK